MNGTSTGSEAAALIKRLDWAQSPLGEASEWPQSLRTAVDIVVHYTHANGAAVGPTPHTTL